MAPHKKASGNKPTRKMPARPAKKAVNYNVQQLTEAATRRAKAARDEQPATKPVQKRVTKPKKPVKKPTVKKPAVRKPKTSKKYESDDEDADESDDSEYPVEKAVKKPTVKKPTVNKPTVNKPKIIKKNDPNDETPSPNDSYTVARDTAYAAEVNRLQRLKKQETTAKARGDEKKLDIVKAQIKAQVAKVKKMKA